MSPELDPRVERTRRRVLAATIDELVEVGFERLTIDAVADRSGVARSTIYRNWEDRPALLLDAFRQLAGEATVDVAEASDLAEGLRLLGQALRAKLADERWMRTVPSLIGAAAHGGVLQDMIRTFSEERRQESLEVVCAAVDRGEIEDRGQIDGALERFVAPFFMRALMSQRPIDQEFIERQVRASLGDLGAVDTVSPCPHHPPSSL